MITPKRIRTLRHRAAAAGLALLTIPTLVVGGGPAGAAAPLDPRVDPFYAVPSNVGAFAPGQIIASRSVSVAAFGAFGIRARSWQVKYRTNDNLGQPTATLTTILVPDQAAAAAVRPVVSYQTAEDSNSLQCAPSYGLLTGAPTNNPASQAETIIIAGYLARGDIVVVPDYEGPHSLYTEGPMAGRAVLDGISAARAFAPAGIAASAPVGVTGYSGGAWATEWAAQLQPSYSPGVRIAAVVAGGVPVSVAHTAAHITYGPDLGLFDGVVLNGITGEYNAHPELHALAAAYLTARGVQIIKDLSSKCGSATLTDYAFTPYTVMFKQADPLNTISPIKAIVAENTLGGAIPDRVPTYLYQAANDELLPSADVDALVARDCAAGVPIRYDKDLLSDHVSLAITGAPAAIAFMQAQLTGMRQTTCSSTTTISTVLSVPAALSALQLALGLPTVLS